MTVVNELPSSARCSRLLNAAAADLAGHRALAGPVPWRGGVGRLIGDVQAAGLTGRGGAGLPTWRKLAAVATAERPAVVANAAESEPAAAKDSTLLIRCPHLVLDGLQLAAETVGATAVYLYVKPGPAERTARAALAERAAKRWDRYPVRVVEAEETFIAGEESAVLAKIAGRWTVHKGLRGRVTLVQNVETLAHLAQIARHGPGWFRRLGTPDEPGTFLATVGGAVTRPDVYEVPIGMATSALIGLAGGPAAPLQAVLIGGYHGIWLPYPMLGHTALSRAALGPLGGTPGTGVVLGLPATRCGLRETAGIVRYLAAQRAGGPPDLADQLDALAGLRGTRRAVDTLVELSTVAGDSGGAARLVGSALDAFAAEVQLHLAGRCSARRSAEERGELDP